MTVDELKAGIFGGAVGEKLVDVIVCTDDVLDGVPREVIESHPVLTKTVSLGERLAVGPLPSEWMAAVLEACRCSRYQSMVPEKKGLYAFTYVHHPGGYGNFDPPSAANRALQISRLVRPSPTGFAFAAVLRLSSEGTVLQTVPAKTRYEVGRAYVVPGQLPWWLSDTDADRLKELLAAYTPVAAGTRLHDAFYNFAMWAFVYRLPLRLAGTVAIVERLICLRKKDPHAQFIRRLPLLGKEVDRSLDRKWCEALYDDRSIIAHGERLFDPSRGTPKTSAQEAELNGRLRTLEDLVRAVLSRAILDREFRELFTDDGGAIGRKWPVPVKACPTCRGKFPAAKPVRCPQCQREWEDDVAGELSPA